MKTCFLCKIKKDRSEFYKDKNRGDGFCSTCKECTFLRSKIYRADGSRPRKHKKKDPLLHLKHVRKYEENNKEKKDAWRALRLAIKAKKITKWPVCAVFDCEAIKPEAHHPDYSRPLDVIWLCPAHHKQAHRSHLE